MKKMLIAGNWKMNTNSFESEKLAEYICGGLIDKQLKSNVLICPPFTSLMTMNSILKGSPVKLGAQNCHYEPNGAFTGEISVQMLAHLHCEYVIIGHSERRQYFFETDEIVNKKLHSVLQAGMNAIVCIGETIDERQSSKTFDVLSRQLMIGLQNIDASFCKNIVIAYEPVWAIGTGLAATSEQVQEAHFFIKEELLSNLGNDAMEIMVLYGGSMNEKNACELLSLKDVNGGLIGGASLKGDSFLKIIYTSEDVLIQ